MPGSVYAHQAARTLYTHISTAGYSMSQLASLVACGHLIARLRLCRPFTYHKVARVKLASITCQCDRRARGKGLVRGGQRLAPRKRAVTPVSAGRKRAHGLTYAAHNEYYGPLQVQVGPAIHRLPLKLERS